MIVDGVKFCNKCRQAETETALVERRFRVRATGHELPLLHLCLVCVPEYEAKSGLELLEGGAPIS